MSAVLPAQVGDSTTRKLTAARNLTLGTEWHENQSSEVGACEGEDGLQCRRWHEAGAGPNVTDPVALELTVLQVLA